MMNELAQAYRLGWEDAAQHAKKGWAPLLHEWYATYRLMEEGISVTVDTVDAYIHAYRACARYEQRAQEIVRAELAGTAAAR